MKRLDILKLIANQLAFLNGTFDGVQTKFSEEELKSAEVILTTLEHANVLNKDKLTDCMLCGYKRDLNASCSMMFGDDEQ